MAVSIRLSRAGARNNPLYSVVVTDQSARRDGNYLAKIGYYNPKADKDSDKLKVDADQVKAWVAKGAQCSETIAKLLKASGIRL